MPGTEADEGDERPEGGPDGVRAYRALRELAGDILTRAEPDDILLRCAATLHALLAVDALNVALFDARTRTLRPLLTMAGGRRTDDEAPPTPLPLPAGRMTEAILGGRALIVSHNALLDGAHPLLLERSQGLLTAMLLPLPNVGSDTGGGGRAGGILWLGRVYGAPFTAAEQELAETIAGLMALAVRGMRPP